MKKHETMFDRIQQRLNDLGLTERAASVQAVGNPDLIRNMKRNRSRSPRGEGLTRLAAVLRVSESWLLGSTDTQNAEAAENVADGVRFGGIVEAGAFRTVNLYSQDEEYRTIPIQPNPHYPPAAQFAFQVMGDSMTRADIREGMYVLAVEVHAWQHLHGEPGDGKLVVVARTRNGDPERELTVKQLRIFRDRMELQPMSDNPQWKPIAFPLAGTPSEEEVQIIAVVLQATRLY